ncbi:MAG TPA: alcohol dehydrogenase, partial [Wenzhouxiangella sp.]|nr:alcohol dehydrogenase [Wenzhouxiangella sp.]
MNVLITGNSGGLGLGFTEVLLERNAIIWGMSRRGCPLADDSQDGLR